MKTLIKKAQHKDADAFVELMQENMKDMYKVARAILSNDEDAADAIQDTILACWEKIHTLKQEEFFKTWLTRILINNCTSYSEKNESLCWMTVSWTCRPAANATATKTPNGKKCLGVWMRNTVSSLFCTMWKVLKSGKSAKYSMKVKAP